MKVLVLGVLSVVLLLGAPMAMADCTTSCAAPIQVNVSSLPYTDTYSDASCTGCTPFDDGGCLGSYDDGAGSFYRVTNDTGADILLQVNFQSTTGWTGLAAFTDCADMGNCLWDQTSSGALLVDRQDTLAAGASVYLLADTWPSPSCANYTLELSIGVTPSDYTVDDTCSTPFEDVSGTGTALGLADDGEGNIQMPFDFGFFGTVYPAPVDLRVGNNGGILFDATVGDVIAGNAALVAGGARAVFPFWDDLDDETGDVFWEVLGSAPDRRLIVQWHERPHYNGIGAATFQVVFYEATSEIVFVYDDVEFGDAAFDFGASATVGLQGPLAVQYSFNTPSLSNGMCISFVPDFVPVELQAFSIE